MADTRLLLARPDLADAFLEGLSAAGRYAWPRTFQVGVPVASVRAAPSAQSEQIDQVLFGEAFDVLDSGDGFAWGQARRDGYVGHVKIEALTEDVLTPTHRVSALRAFAFAQPAVRAAARGPFSHNALMTVTEENGSYALAIGAGWVPKVHLSPIGLMEAEPATVVERFVGAPYLWGGRDSLGLDCSGLIQQALHACGRACPRDADQQQTLGKEVSGAALERGDLVFWRGHVGMMLDAQRLGHANAHHMAVAVEPLAEAVMRIRESGAGDPVAFRRS